MLFDLVFDLVLDSEFDLVDLVLDSEFDLDREFVLPEDRTLTSLEAGGMRRLSGMAASIALLLAFCSRSFLDFMFTKKAWFT